MLQRVMLFSRPRHIYLKADLKKTKPVDSGQNMLNIFNLNPIYLTRP